MTVLCALGKYHYGKRELGIGMEFAGFTAGFRAVGCTVEHFDPDTPGKYCNYADLNKAFLDHANALRPDIVFTVQRDYEYWAETLNLIRANTGARLVTWVTDDSFKYDTVSRYIAAFYDAIVTTCPQLSQRYQKDDIRNVHVSQWAANPECLRRPKPAKRCAIGVSFIGAAHGRRKAMVRSLTEAGISVKCFGEGWDNGPVKSQDVPDIMNESVVSLNFANAYRGDNQIKMRNFEVPGAGGLLVTEHAVGIESYFDDGKEIVTFKSISDAITRIKVLLENSEMRDDMCSAAYERTKKEHTFACRMKALLGAIPTVRHTRADNLVAGLESALKVYELTLPLKAFRAALSMGTQAVWGREKGARAARRAVFEYSVRMYGRKTFTAAGLPGRLFPFP